FDETADERLFQILRRQARLPRRGGGKAERRINRQSLSPIRACRRPRRPAPCFAHGPDDVRPGPLDRQGARGGRLPPVVEGSPRGGRPGCRGGGGGREKTVTRRPLPCRASSR